MKTKIRFTFFACFLFLFGCQSDPDKRFTLSGVSVMDVSQKITDLETDQILTSPVPYISGKYLMLVDIQTNLGEKGVHIFDKNSFDYLGSTGIVGEGPGEIIQYGEIGITPDENVFWLPDFAKLRMFRFRVDSALMDENYLPRGSLPFSNDFFLSRLKFVSEELALGSGVEVLSPSTFRTSLGKWDLLSGKVEKFGYEHPRLKNERTNAYFDYSYDHQLMALSYGNYDVLSVFDAEGNAKFNLIGEKEFNNENRNLKFFGQVQFTKDYIFSSYLGDNHTLFDANGNPIHVMPSKLLMFNLEGDLLKILETGHDIRFFAVDGVQNRVICYSYDRPIPIGYFSYD
jgi:hypothetical protein